MGQHLSLPASAVPLPALSSSSSPLPASSHAPTPSTASSVSASVSPSSPIHLLSKTNIVKLAESHVSTLRSKYNSINNSISMQNEIAEENETVLDNMHDLLNKYKSSTETTQDTLDNVEKKLETSQRGVWYTHQRIDIYLKYQHILSIILKLLLLITIILFIYKKRYISLVSIIVLYLLISHFL